MRNHSAHYKLFLTSFMNAKLHRGWRILRYRVKLSFNFYFVSKFETSHCYICDMEERYRKYLNWWFAELTMDPEAQVERYLTIFPELKSRLSKFGVGILLWNMKGLFDIDNPDDVSRVRLILKVLDQTPGFDFFDNTFNECYPETVCRIIGMSPKILIDEPTLEFDYTVFSIDSYENARQWQDMTSWCIVISEKSFKSYTTNGNRFYFCGNGDWWDIPCVPGATFPHDRYGYSLIAVEVTPDNKIASITSRWNTYSGDNGYFIGEDELKKILGDANYDKMLCINA